MGTDRRFRLASRQRKAEARGYPRVDEGDVIMVLAHAARPALVGGEKKSSQQQQDDKPKKMNNR
jgi:hypothetical protein